MRPFLKISEAAKLSVFLKLSWFAVQEQEQKVQALRLGEHSFHPFCFRPKLPFSIVYYMFEYFDRGRNYVGEEVSRFDLHLKTQKSAHSEKKNHIGLGHPISYRKLKYNVNPGLATHATPRYSNVVIRCRKNRPMTKRPRVPVSVNILGTAQVFPICRRHSRSSLHFIRSLTARNRCSLGGGCYECCCCTELTFVL